jgi:cation:H+ antiporter
MGMLAGLITLAVGGEILVRGASALAAALRISPLVIGLTVVAFGTSAPELAVTLQAGLIGQPDVAVGNVVGSNIANVLLILGLSSLAAPLVVSSQLVRFDVPLMIAASLALPALGYDGVLARHDGAVLFGSLLVYTVWAVRKSRAERREVQEEFSHVYAEPAAKREPRLLVQIALIVVGLILLGLGSRWLVRGAVDLARLAGVGELIIGLTIVAVGTSLPELVTSVVAALRGERDIAVGNIVGSNLFNILGVLGLSSLIAPGGIRLAPAALRFDIPVMIAVAVACLPIFFTGRRIARWEGALFLGYYVAYVTYLVLDATNAIVSRQFRAIMLGYVIPLTALTLAIGVFRSVRQSEPQAGP